jgi:hypothetical protein
LRPADPVEFAELFAKRGGGSVFFGSGRLVLSGGRQGNRNQRTSHKQGGDKRFHSYDLSARSGFDWIAAMELDVYPFFDGGLP